MLEEAYKRVNNKEGSGSPVLFRDKKGNPIKQGDIVKLNSVKYKIVGAKTVLGTGIKKDQVQLEQAEGTLIGDIPKLIWTTPNQVIKQ